MLQGEIRANWRRGRRHIYGPEVAQELTKLWQLMDYVCGKRMAATLPGWMKAWKRHGEFELSDEGREASVRIRIKGTV